MSACPTVWALEKVANADLPLAARKAAFVKLHTEIGYSVACYSTDEEKMITRDLYLALWSFLLEIVDQPAPVETSAIYKSISSMIVDPIFQFDSYGLTVSSQTLDPSSVAYDLIQRYEGCLWSTWSTIQPFVLKTNRSDLETSFLSDVVAACMFVFPTVQFFFLHLLSEFTCACDPELSPHCRIPDAEFSADPDACEINPFLTRFASAPSGPPLTNLVREVENLARSVVLDPRFLYRAKRFSEITPNLFSWRRYKAPPGLRQLFPGSAGAKDWRTEAHNSPTLVISLISAWINYVYQLCHKLCIHWEYIPSFFLVYRTILPLLQACIVFNYSCRTRFLPFQREVSRAHVYRSLLLRFPPSVNFIMRLFMEPCNLYVKSDYEYAMMNLQQYITTTAQENINYPNDQFFYIDEPNYIMELLFMDKSFPFFPLETESYCFTVEQLVEWLAVTKKLPESDRQEAELIVNLFIRSSHVGHFVDCDGKLRHYIPSEKISPPAFSFSSDSTDMIPIWGRSLSDQSLPEIPAERSKGYRASFSVQMTTPASPVLRPRTGAPSPASPPVAAPPRERGSEEVARLRCPERGSFPSCFDVAYFSTLLKLVIKTDDHRYILNFLSFLYQIIPFFGGEVRKSFIVGTLLGEAFQFLFFHWDYSVRTYFDTILIYKLFLGHRFYLNRTLCEMSGIVYQSQRADEPTPRRSFFEVLGGKMKSAFRSLRKSISFDKTPYMPSTFPEISPLDDEICQKLDLRLRSMCGVLQTPELFVKYSVKMQNLLEESMMNYIDTLIEYEEMVDDKDSHPENIEPPTLSFIISEVPA